MLKMSSTVTKVMAIRVKNETAEYFKGKPLNKVVENVHGLVKDGDLKIDNEGKVKINDSKCTGDGV